MNHPKHGTTTFSAIAAAVALALGSAAAMAQHSQNGQQPQSAQRSAAQQQSAAQAHSQAGSASAGQTFDKLAQNHANLSTFADAVKAAGLEDSLTSGTKYTVFAPTNKAFESMKGQSVDELMKPENREQLVKILRAHIVADDIDPQQAHQLSQAETIDGNTVDIQSHDGSLMVGDAKVVNDQGFDMGTLRIYPIDDVLAANPQHGSPSAANRESGRQSNGGRG